MSVLTIRIPENKHERLRNLAKSRGVSVNKLIEELSTIALAQHDTEVASEPWRRVVLPKKDSRCWRSSTDSLLVHGDRPRRISPANQLTFLLPR